MSIYIDNGKSVEQYCTNKKTEKALRILLQQIEDMVSSETHDGFTVAIREREDWEKDGGKCK